MPPLFSFSLPRSRHSRLRMFVTSLFDNITSASADRLRQKPFHCRAVLRLALPNHAYPPPKFTQSPGVAPRFFDNAIELLLPVLLTRLRHSSLLAPRMAVPEAPMNEYDRPIPREHQIRRSRQILAVQPEPESHRMRLTPDDHFRRRVFRPHTGHQPGPPLRSQPIHSRHSAASIAIPSTPPKPSVRRMIARKIASATKGATLLPMIRKLCQAVG